MKKESKKEDIAVMSVRFPRVMKEVLEKRAAENERTLAGEITHRLKKSIEDETKRG